ncbi:MAG: 3-dehydroquinate synthase [Leptolyngbya sp.]|nr:3-dehydroquinate synthase [Candidatus Melainabacteria bacterium]
MAVSRHKTRHRGPVITMLWNTALEVKTRVAVGSGARTKLSGILAQISAGKKVLVLCQPTTAVQWLREILAAIPSDDYHVSTLEVPDGETCKSTEWLVRIWEHLQERHFDRRDTIVALGGGSVTDLAGFAASTYMRGMNLVIIPTSLLAQVDAAIGGKTGINLPAGKNLAGTFFFPRAVLADPELLSSLPKKQFVSGMAEIIKYALIEETVAKHTDYEVGQKKLFDVLNTFVNSGFDYEDPVCAGLITSSIKMKLFVVGKDPHEGGLRRMLNFGHTLGHALEKVADYRLTHGEAVAIGMAAVTRLSVTLKKLPKAEGEKVIKLLENAGLPTELPPNLDRQKLIESMAHDKKREGASIKLVLPVTRLGMVDYEFSLPIEEVDKLI